MSGDRSFKAPAFPADDKELTRRTRRAFVTMAVGGVVGYGGWAWARSRPEDGGVESPFRSMLRLNEKVAQTYYGENRLAPEFAASRVQPLRVNGDVGLGTGFDEKSWKLLLKPLGDRGAAELAMNQIRALPRYEYITQLKCIEGWSVVNHWAGARFADFTQKFAPESASAPYVGLNTPDGEYFVGLDIASAMHPQTLLCYEMNGAALLPENGAPLRLAIPVKYGIKNLKRIGSIVFSAQRPRDYWAEEGYDWYAGL